MPDLLFTLYLLVYFPLSNIWHSSRKRTAKPPRPPFAWYWRQGRMALGLLIVLGIVMWLGHYSLADLGLGFPRSPAALAGLAIAVCVMLVAHVAGKWMDRRMTPEKRLDQEAKLRAMPIVMPRTTLETAAYCITMIGMTAAWEILFRGYALLVLTPVTGLPAAVALAAIAYGAGHGYKSAGQFFGAIAMSFAFTIGYALTGSLWWLIILHAAAPVSMLFVMRKVNAVRTPEIAYK